MLKKKYLMDSFSFWQKWLFGFGLYLIVFGLVLSFFSHTTLMDYVFNNQIDPVFWGLAELPENAEKFQAWIYGVLGAVISGWGVVISFIAYYPFKAKERWAWNCIGSGFIFWFVIDTVISIYYHAGFNVFINITFLLFVLLPLFFTRKHFIKKNADNA